MRVHIFLIVLMFLFLGTTKAQDPHFSQYFSSPLTLNPANTGNFDASGRFAFNFRNQWQGIGEPYLTGTFSYDGDFLKKEAGSGNKFSIGFMGMYDHTTRAKFTSSYLGVSIGYHINLDEEGFNRLSIGFQSTFANMRLDYSRISFADQFASYGFDLSLPNNQVFETGNINYSDWNTGMIYDHKSDYGSYYIGFSSYHLNRPAISFLGNIGNKIPVRLNFQTGGFKQVGSDDMLFASALLMSQGPSVEKCLGLSYSHDLANITNHIRMNAGLWYRVNDAIIPYLGYTFNNFQMAITYDITTSGLNLARTRNRSIELSMIYHIIDLKDYKKMIPWY